MSFTEEEIAILEKIFDDRYTKVDSCSREHTVICNKIKGVVSMFRYVLMAIAVFVLGLIVNYAKLSDNKEIMDIKFEKQLILIEKQSEAIEKIEQAIKEIRQHIE
jgi:hypothetical protein